MDNVLHKDFTTKQESEETFEALRRRNKRINTFYHIFFFHECIWFICRFLHSSCNPFVIDVLFKIPLEICLVPLLYQHLSLMHQLFIKIKKLEILEAIQDCKGSGYIHIQQF